MASRSAGLHSPGGINVCSKGSRHSNSGKSQSKCHVQIMSHRCGVSLLSVETIENSRIRGKSGKQVLLNGLEVGWDTYKVNLPKLKH